MCFKLDFHLRDFSHFIRESNFHDNFLTFSEYLYLSNRLILSIICKHCLYIYFYSLQVSSSFGKVVYLLQPLLISTV